MAGPSMKDVARHAQVSLGTVSNVLNHPDMVADPTRTRVLESIAELGFVRNESARQLRGGGSRTLAYVVLDMRNPYFTDVAAGARQAAEEAGLSLFLCDGGEDRERQASYLDLLEQQRVEGVLITPVDASDPRIAALAARGTPVVLVDRGAGPEHCSVAVDDVLGGDLAVTHLLETGHRNIAFVGGPKAIGQVGDRVAGAERAIARADAEPLTVLETARLDVTEGRRAGERLAGLPAGRRPTAAFCANDLLALGLLQQAIQLGLRVPDDLAIVGYDDIEFAEAAAVPLTSVAQPRHALGHSAATMALAESRDGTDHEHRHVVSDPELVVRSSTRLRPMNGVA